MTKSRSVALLDGQAPPRVKHAPTVRANSWEDVADLVAAYGLVLDPWQEEVLRAGLGERSNGKWAVRQIGVCAPRQQGKTMVIAARVLAGLLLFDEQTIIVSAHRQDTAREVFFRLVQLIEDNPSLEERVDFIARSEMREFIRLKSGQEVRFKARSSGSGRGFSCDCLMLDEAQILGSAAWSAILPTMSARPNPQVWLLGTPPTPLDDGEVFSRIREAGIEGKESRIAYLEWSADVGDDMDDPETWAKANPAFGTRISHEAVASERATMGDDQFAMERLGIWSATLGAARQAIDPDAWTARAIPSALPEWPLAAIGLDMDLSGRLWTSVAAHAGESGTHLELLPDNLLAGGQEAVVAWLWERCKRRLPVVMPAESGARVLQAPLLAKGMKVYALNAPEMVQMSASLVQGIKDETVTHLDDALLQAAVESSERDEGKSGQWRIRRAGEANGAPLLAVAAAHFGSIKWSKRRRPGDEKRRVVVLS